MDSPNTTFRRPAVPKRTYSAYFEPFGWVVGTGNYVDRLEAQVEELHRIGDEENRLASIAFLTVLGLGTAAALTAAVFLSRRISRPLVSLNTALAELAHGDADLGRVLPVTSKDETGQLATSFNEFCAKLNAVLLTVRTSTEELGRSAGEVSASTVQTAAAVKEINATIEGVNEMVERSDQSVTQTSATVQEIVRNVEHFNGMITSQADGVERSSADMRVMSKELVQLGTDMAGSRKLMEDLTEQAVQGREALDNVIALIAAIAGQSEALMETNDVISTIASQTNLLAMNAAIESAHAGDAGKGFSVVSDEIRKLAEGAAVQAGEISKVLEEVRQMIDKVAAASRDTGSRFDIMAEGIVQVAATETRVAESLGRQMEANGRMVEVFEGIRQLSLEIRSGSAEMAEGNRLAFEELQELVRISGELRGSMSEIRKGTTEIGLSVDALSQLSTDNTRSLDEVLAITRRFRLREA